MKVRHPPRLREMGDAIGLFCDGLPGLFNQCRLRLARGGCHHHRSGHFCPRGLQSPTLAIAVVSCLNMINHIAESDQFGAREIVVTIDEAHIITTNPLAGPFWSRSSKCGASLGPGCGATQNMEELPGRGQRKCSIWWSGGCVW